jgi:polyhydroxyalkanoate synthesis regulator phasin
LRDGDTFRITLARGGAVSLPIGLPAEVVTPFAVRLRVTRAGGETEVRPAPGGDTGEAAGGAARGAGVPDFSEIAEVMAERGRRVVQEVARAVRSGGGGVSDELARKLEEAEARIEAAARHAAERVQREVDRSVQTAERYEEHGRRAAERVVERAGRHAERHAERVERFAEHATRRAGRGRSWFAERLDEWATANTGGSAGARAAAAAPRATEDERLAIMQMLRDGKLSAEQAAQLLDALGG